MRQRAEMYVRTVTVLGVEGVSVRLGVMCELGTEDVKDARRGVQNDEVLG